MLSKIKLFLLITLMALFSSNLSANYDKLVYDFNFKDLDGSTISLSEYKNKVIVIVNVASQCGFTSQYEDMQKVWDSYQDKGLIMIGVPSNDFGNQEPAAVKKLRIFVKLNLVLPFQ